MTVVRDKLGRLAKGSVLNPYGKTGKSSSQYLEALARAVPADRVDLLIDDVIEIAYKQNSGKMIIEVLRLILDYRVGRPVQRSLSASADVTKFISLLNGDMTGIEELFAEAMEDARGQTVDGEVTDEDGE